MIKSVQLINFQSHENNTIIFNKGVNSILGDTDCGKTSIFRAINWVLFNKPSGKEYVSHWADETKVIIKQDSGVTVSKGRDKKGNYYTVSGIKGEFRAIGLGTPPEEVIKALNLESINIQKQLDSPFLLSESSSQIAKKLNSVLDLEIIDHSVSKAKKQKSQAESNLKTEKEILSKMEENYNQYDYLEKMEKEVLLLEKIKNQKTKLENEIWKINDLLIRQRELLNKINEFEKILKFQNTIESLILNISRYNNEKEKWIKLRSILYNIKSKSKKIEKGIKLISASPQIQNTQEKIDKYRELKKINITLDLLIKRINTKKNTVSYLEKTYDICNKELVKNQPSICPLCESELKK